MSLFARPRWRFFQSLLADFFLSYQCSLQSYVDHWAPTKVLLSLGDSESSQVPGLVLHLSGVSSSDSATLAAKDMCLSVITVVNSFTESLRLILLPGEDVQKVSFRWLALSMCFRLFRLVWVSTMASPVLFSTSRQVCGRSPMLHPRSGILCLNFRSMSFSPSSRWVGVPPFN